MAVKEGAGKGKDCLAHNRWTILAVLTLVRTAMAFQFQSVASVSPLVMADLGIDYAALGALIGFYMLPGIVIALPGGVLGRRFGDVPMCLAGLALMAVGGALMGFADAYAAQAVGRAVSGIGAVILNVLLAKMTADWFAGREIVTAMAILVNSWPLGIAIGLMTQGALAEAAGWRVVMHVAAAACVASLGLLAMFYRPPPGVPTESPAKSTNPASPGASIAASFRLGLGRRELVLVLLAGAMWSLYNVGYIVLVSFGPDYLAAAGRPVAEAGAIASLATWVMLVSIPLGGFVAERFGRPDAVLAFCLAASGALIAALLMWDAPVLLFVLIGVVVGPGAGIIMALPARAARAENRAPALGLYYTCYYVGMAVLPAAAGLARDVSGRSGAPLLFAAAMMLLTLAALGAFRWAEARG